MSADCIMYTGENIPKNLMGDALRNEIVHEILETDEVQKQLDRGEDVNTRYSHRDAIREHLERYDEWLTPIEYFRWALSYVRDGDGSEFPVSPIYVDGRGKVKVSNVEWSSEILKHNRRLDLEFIIDGKRMIFPESKVIELTKK